MESDTPVDDPEEQTEIAETGAGDPLELEEDLASKPIGVALRERLSKENIRSYISMWGLYAALSIPFWLFVMWMAYLQGAITGSSPPRSQFGAGFLGLVILFYVLHEMIDRVGGGTAFITDDLRALVSRENVVDTAILGVSVLIMIPTVVYVYVNALALAGRGGATQAELAMALLFTVSIIYITWRAFGMTFLVIVLAGIAYGLFGYVIPGPLGHTGISWTRMLRILVIQVDGFFGFLTQLMAAWIALFLLYAGMLKGYGAFDLILRAAVKVGQHIDSGVAQTAVIASAIIGSVNGSQTANTGMTGSFTIPMMKRSGIKPATAGAIESVASTSGQVLPPVMGAGAFVMATLIQGVTYFDVIVAGLIPAAILLIVIFIGVHYSAAPQIDEGQMDDFFEDRIKPSELAIQGVKFGVPLGVLIYLLGVLQYTVMTSAFWTVVSMAALGITVPTTRQAAGSRSLRRTFWTFVDTLRQTVVGFREGLVVCAPVAIILASINGVVDILLATGVPGALSLTLIDISGGILIFVAVMAMVISIILGLGMPTTAKYTITAILIAPTFVNQFFLPEFAAHFFVFYAAILAGLTPPVATCVAVATGIAGSDFWETSWEAIKISAPLFVLPFTFIYHPELVNHQGTVGTGLLLTSLVTLLGGVTIIHGLNYRFSIGSSRIVGLRGRQVEISSLPAAGLRTVFVGLGIVIMVHPELIVQLGALAVAVFLYLTQAATGEESPFRKILAAAEGINGRRK